MSTWDDVLPIIREGLRATASDMRHESSLDGRVDGRRIEAVEDGASLVLLVRATDNVIAAARHAGGGSEVRRALLEGFCAQIEGVPIQEAADHGSVRLLNSLRNRNQVRPVSGILMPRNTHPDFVLLEHLIRRARDGYAALAGLTDRQNFYEVPPSSAWLARTDQQRTLAVTESIRAFATGHGLSADAITLRELTNDIQKHPVRLFVSFDPDLDPDRKPVLARALEGHLKDRVEWRLELHNEEMHDANRLRRL